MQASKTQQNHINYLWDGNRQLQQNTDTHTHTIIYEQDSFEPVAQLIWVRDGISAANDEPTAEELRDAEGWYGNNKPIIKTGVQLYHYHNDHLGTPNELTDQQGDVVWFADYEAYGNTATVEWKSQRIDNIVVSEEHLQPIRFQGQSFDTETGLHYNRFRYFDPDLGMFTTRDPIGLMGGSNVFAYAPNPTGWIDPFGLKCTDADAPYGTKKDGTPKNKPGPKTDPNGPHNTKIREIGDKIESEGGTVLAGGGKRSEQLIPTPGGNKGGRRPDILYEQDGVIKGVNVGKTKVDGSPIKREQQALDDLNNKGGVPTTFERYD